MVSEGTKDMVKKMVREMSRDTLRETTEGESQPQARIGRPSVFNGKQLKGEKLHAYNRELYGTLIRQHRLKMGLSQIQIAGIVGVTPNAITNWEAGRTRPDTNTLPKLCAALGITASEFFGMPDVPVKLPPNEQRLLDNYRILSAFNRRVITNLMDAMIENDDKLLRERCENGFERIRRGSLLASAGTGYDLSDDNKYEYVYVRTSREACHADEIITVSGDSMAPTFLNGDDVFVEYTEDLLPGEIGIYVAAGEGYIKEYRKDGLYSHNPRYPALYFEDDDNLRCVGRVLGIVEKDQYASKLEMEVIRDIRKEKALRK